MALGTGTDSLGRERRLGTNLTTINAAWSRNGQTGDRVYLCNIAGTLSNNQMTSRFFSFPAKLQARALRGLDRVGDILELFQRPMRPEELISRKD
ncbi:MAG: hypothetical protein ACLQAT_02365 [Candidatus Binataceae bacterium]